MDKDGNCLNWSKFIKSSILLSICLNVPNSFSIFLLKASTPLAERIIKLFLSKSINALPLPLHHKKNSRVKTRG